VESKIYESILKHNNIDIIYPSAVQQETVNNIIVDLLDGKSSNSHTKNIELICNSVEKKVSKAILLACTDLQLAITNLNSSITIIDTTDVLIKASVLELLKNNL